MTVEELIGFLEGAYEEYTVVVDTSEIVPGAAADIQSVEIDDVEETVTLVLEQ